jgi:LPS export ABC transporter protein LptC
VKIRNNVSLIGGLLVVCVAGYYWGGLSQDTPLTRISDPNTPDYALGQLQGVQINEQGQIERTLSAQQLQHYNQRDESIISQPQMILYQNNQATWQLSAQQATASNNNQELRLINEVLAKRLNSTPLQLSTQSLYANQNSHILQTHDPVMVSTAQGQISSLGLEANTELGILQLTGQVRGTYVLPPP